MKKLISGILAVLMIAGSAAMAERVTLAGTSYSVDLPTAMVCYELEEEDIEEGMTDFYADEQDTIQMGVYVEDNDGWTIEELGEALIEEVGSDKAGTVEINGKAAVYSLTEEDGDLHVEYDLIDGDKLVMIIFYLGDDSAKATSKSIMESLQ